MTRINLNYDYEKHKTAMRYWLQGKGWHLALKALEMGLEHHVGRRKDGTPEFSHQIFQAQYVRTLPDLIYPEETMSVVFLHDIVEDCGVSFGTIHQEFGELVGTGVDLMSDIDAQGKEKPADVFFAAMVASPVASLGKGVDRSHNFQSMLPVFSIEKQERYIKETRQHIIPMLKAARKKYTQQEPAYQNVKHLLLTQIELIEAMHSVTLKR